MKKLLPLLFFILLSAYGNAQIKLYVSAQGNQKCTYKTPAPVSACADEGRQISIALTPSPEIEISPTSINLPGPDCPTYDEKGNRIPKEVTPPNCQQYEGTITPNIIPPAGTTVTATITGKDNGYWTKCSTGEKHFFTDAHTYNVEIISIKLQLRDEVQIGIGEEVTITATTYPPGMPVDWVVLPSCLKIIAYESNYVTIKNTGDCFPMANLELGTVKGIIGDSCAVYSQVVNVKSKGLEEVVLWADCPGAGRYNRVTQKCYPCGGINHVRPATEDTDCCGGWPYDDAKTLCADCGGKKKLIARSKNLDCCGPKGKTYNTKTQDCIDCGKNRIIVGKGFACCNGKKFDTQVHKCLECDGKKILVLNIIKDCEDYSDLFGYPGER